MLELPVEGRCVRAFATAFQANLVAVLGFFS